MEYKNGYLLHANRYNVDVKQNNEITDFTMNTKPYGSRNKNALKCTHKTYRSHRRKTISRCANVLFLLLRINYLLVWKLILFSLLISSVSTKEQKFAMEPQDQSAVIGSRVTLPCRVVNKVGQLQWTKDDFGLGTHRHLVGYERYKMIGSDDEGDYSLDIQKVSLDDDAIYQCQVSSGPRGEPAIRSRYARLIILVPPEPPRILQGSVLEAVEDREVNLECVSIGGKPAAEITWVDHEGGVITQGVTYTVETLADERRYTARSTLHLRPRRHHHNQTFTCQAQNTADRAYRASTITVQVQYAPRVRIYKTSGAGKLRVSESETLSLGCQAYANPNDLVYKWYINNQPIIENSKSELVLPNVSRKYNEATVKCEAYNSVGKSADTKTLEVTYGPTFKISPQNVEAEIGSVVTLNCVVEGNPAPKILWHRYEHNRVIIVGRSSNLTVTVSQRSTGQYVCRASVEGYKDVEAFASVYLKGPPKITTNLSQYGMEGDSVRIECISLSIPKPDYVTWSFGGYEINSFNDREYAFLEETLADGFTKSTLIIRESKSVHFGTYNCSVTNIYGTDSVEIHLLPDKSFPLILIISACASLAILLLIALLLVMLCHRKSKKTELAHKPDITDVGKTCLDQFKDRIECDRSSNKSDLKLELRHVEGSCDMENLNQGSDTEFHSSLHLTSNLGLPLAGPVTLSDAGYDNELIKQYHRYSGDFNDTASSLNFKVHSHNNGYVPYVDYTRDYAPPAQLNDSLNGSLSKSIDSSTYSMPCQPLNRQSSCGRLSGLVGPDVIPMTNSGVFLSSGLDVRYAATYGNPYLRGSGPLSYVPQINTSTSSTTQAPPPYYSTRSNNLPLPMPPLTPLSSSSSSKPASSPQASSSSTNSGAQPQVPKLSSQSSGASYPPSSQIFQATQITTKGKLRTGTHV